MSSQDKAGPQDGTEDAATEGRAPDTAETPPETPPHADNDGGTPIEDAEIVDDPAGIDDEAADENDAETDAGAVGNDDGADDLTAMDGASAEDPDTPQRDAPDGMDDAGTPDMGSDPDTGDGDTPGTDAGDRTGAAAAAFAGTAAGAALGSGGSGGADGASGRDAERPRPTSPPPAPQKSGGGFVPAFLGGVIAAGLGVGAVLYLGGGMIGGDDDAVEQALAAQDGQLSALDTKLTELSEAMAAPDDNGAGEELAALGDRLAEQLGGVADRIETLAGNLDSVQSGVDSLDTRLAAVTDRLSAVEQRPLNESSEASAAAFSAYEDDIAELRAALEEQTAQNEALSAELEERSAAAQAEVEAAAARAAELQAQAEEQARVAMEQADARARAAAVREAVAGLDAALERGAPFENYMSVLSEDAEVPQALADAAPTGVASLPELRETFPDLARDALDASIRETVDDDLTERAVAFLKAQTGFRSLAPRDGDDPDAILSRAEAALRAGDLGTTVSELNQLPPAGQAIMADWIARADQRRTVTEAAETLAANLLAN